MPELRTSPQGRQMIESFEGLRLHAYQDIAGVWTIGYGHTGPEVQPGVVWTKEQCDAALSHRLATEFEPAVNDVCSDVPTTQGQFDAMVCLAYNIGTGGFARSEVAKQHRLHAWDAAADAFEHWDHVNGRVNDALHNRRVTEAEYYLAHSPRLETVPVAKGQPDSEDEGAGDSSGAIVRDGVVYTPAGSDPVGHQKALPPAVVGGLSIPALIWLRVKHGIEFTEAELLGFFGAVSSLLVWLIPHGRR